MNKKLGLGGMRLPLKDTNDTTSIDIEELSQMVDLLIRNGFTYFDTAYTYHDGHSETALRAALVERYARNQYSLTDKLPTLLLESVDQQEDIFNIQLERCGVTYFDRYLIHCATASFYEKALKLNSFEFAIRKKREGKTHMIGFSHHGSPELLDAILCRYPEMDFVQLQINYIDWEHTSIQAKSCYEIAIRHGKSIVAMCPLKGGMLANVPVEAANLFNEYSPSMPIASWSIRYIAGLKSVSTVLSGMSSVEQVKEALTYMHSFKPLTHTEHNIVRKATDIICNAIPVQCTSCGYCIQACPKDIQIPYYLHLYNKYSESGIDTNEYHSDNSYVKASECIDCHNCEISCPQHISISSWIGKTAALLEADR